jgi:hypothetical protein
LLTFPFFSFSPLLAITTSFIALFIKSYLVMAASSQDIDSLIAQTAALNWEDPSS